MPATTSHVSNAVLNLSVQALPSGIKSPAAVRVMFAVDQKGAISSCTPEPTQPFELINNNPALVSVACAQLAEKLQAKAREPIGPGRNRPLFDRAAVSIPQSGPKQRRRRLSTPPPERFKNQCET